MTSSSKIKVRGPALGMFAGALFVWSLAEVVVNFGIEKSFTGDNSMPPAERAALVARSTNIAMAASIIQIVCVVVAIVGPPIVLLVEHNKRKP